MFIDTVTKLRVNINQPYKGFSKLDTPAIRVKAGVEEIAENYPEYDSYEFIFNELDHYPYYVLTARDPEQVAKSKLARTLESRKSAYMNESDPLMYDYLQDKIDKQVWLDKIVEIKERFPK